jgi:hypothetical protein
MMTVGARSTLLRLVRLAKSAPLMVLSPFESKWAVVLPDR